MSFSNASADESGGTHAPEPLAPFEAEWLIARCVEQRNLWGRKMDHAASHNAIVKRHHAIEQMSKIDTIIAKLGEFTP